MNPITIRSARFFVQYSLATLVFSMILFSEALAVASPNKPEDSSIKAMEVPFVGVDPSASRDKYDRIMDFFAMALGSARDLEDLARIFVFDEAELSAVLKDLEAKNLKASLVPAYVISWSKKKRFFSFNSKGKPIKLNLSFLEQLYVVVSGTSFLIRTDLDFSKQLPLLAKAMKDEKVFHSYFFAILLKGLANLERACKPSAGPLEKYCFTAEERLILATKRLPKGKVNSMSCSKDPTWLKKIRIDESIYTFSHDEKGYKSMEKVDPSGQALCVYTFRRSKGVYQGVQPEGMICEGAVPASISGNFLEIDPHFIGTTSFASLLACGASQECCDAIR